MKSYCTVLTIAGSDSSAGAGIQADLKTFAALGCYGASVITALTAQNTMGVQGVLRVPTEFIIEQLDSIFNDIEVRAIKIGMLHNADNIQAVSHYLAKIHNIPIILDPVMVAKGGHLLLENDAIQMLQTHLIPLATLITPNIPEAEVLTGNKIQSYHDMQKAAFDLSKKGAKAVLIKGGHLDNATAKDCLYDAGTDAFHCYELPYITTKNTHGTGCTLSSAIAVNLAKGMALSKAIDEGKIYLQQSLQAGSQMRLGHGHGPVQHFYKS